MVWALHLRSKHGRLFTLPLFRVPMLVIIVEDTRHEVARPEKGDGKWYMSDAGWGARQQGVSF